MTDFTLRLEDHPGAAAQVLEALASEGINLQGGCGLTVSGKGELHLLVDDAEPARRALQGRGIEIEAESEAVMTALEDQPGAAAQLLERVAQAGVNLRALYLATNTRLVLIGDDIQAMKDELQAGVGDPESAD